MCGIASIYVRQDARCPVDRNSNGSIFRTASGCSEHEAAMGAQEVMQALGSPHCARWAKPALRDRRKSEGRLDAVTHRGHERILGVERIVRRRDRGAEDDLD